MRQRVVFDLVVCGLFAVLGLGCQVDKTSFQMDSNSRAPVMGLQLAPNKKAPEVTGVRHTNATAQASTVVDLAHADAPPKQSPWSKLLGRFSKPKRIPLPRTDLQSIEVPEEETAALDQTLDDF